MPTLETHPVQIPSSFGRSSGSVNTDVSLRAYEVYCHLYGPQDAMIKDGCRGGFSTGELIAFLYARTFPQAEWKKRVDDVDQHEEPVTKKGPTHADRRSNPAPDDD